MKMNFSKDELAMVYQYAAGTKEDTLAGLKEIVPVIRDRQTRDIVENTIRKLDAIPEPECRRFIADTKQRFIQKRDNSIRAGLPKPRHRRGRKSHIPREKSQTGNGHNRFQSRSPWTAPLKEGATIHRSSRWRCVLPEAPCREQMISADFQSVPIITGEATLPLRWLPPATPLWTCRPETPCAASCSRPASLQFIYSQRQTVMV